MLTTLTLALALVAPDTMKVDTTQTRIVPNRAGDAWCTTRVITRDEMTDAVYMGLDVHEAKGCNINKAVTRAVTTKLRNGQTRTLFIITQQEGN